MRCHEITLNNVKQRPYRHDQPLSILGSTTSLRRKDVRCLYLLNVNTTHDARSSG
jgi:hypothetical protein